MRQKEVLDRETGMVYNVKTTTTKGTPHLGSSFSRATTIHEEVEVSDDS